MSSAHSSPSPARRLRPDSLAAWLVGGVVVVALAVALAVAVWPQSEADKARDDGERLGTAVAALYDAETPEDVDVALVDVRARAAAGLVGVPTAEDAFEQDLYHSELDTAVGDLADQAQSFHDNAPEVEQAFWDGYETGLSGNAEPTTTSSLD